MTEPSAKEIISRYESGLKIDLDEHSSGRVVLRPVGVLALGDTSALLRERIGELAKRRDLKRVVLDMGGVRYVDSSGIAVMVSGSTALRKNGIDLVLAQLTKKVHDLLQVTKLYTVFKVYDSVEQALSQN
jgi:anti-sigma B factor antagonist